jgi:hypothetical protein
MHVKGKKILCQLSGCSFPREILLHRLSYWIHNVAYLLKAIIAKPLLGNDCVTRNNGVTVGSGVSSAVPDEAI